LHYWDFAADRRKIQCIQLTGYLLAWGCRHFSRFLQNTDFYLLKIFMRTEKETQEENGLLVPPESQTTCSKKLPYKRAFCKIKIFVQEQGM
jgi:hypothetical protein